MLWQAFVSKLVRCHFKYGCRMFIRAFLRAAYLAVASKAAGFSVLLQLVTGPFCGMSETLVPALSIIAIVSILFGNIAAVTGAG